MDRDTALRLCAPESEALIAEVRNTPGDSSGKVLQLRRRWQHLPADFIAGLIQIAEGRERAARRGFFGAEQMMAVPDALAQASSPAVSEFHASLFPIGARVIDACCGIGADLIALARRGLDVVAWETDPARAVFARENARRLAPDATVTVVEGPVPDTLPADAWLFFDPARRDASGRASTDPKRWSPSLSVWESAKGRIAGGVAKFSPGMPDDWLGELGDSVVFVSDQRECKEACVLAGGCAEGVPARAAILLPGDSWIASDASAAVAGQPGHWLLDPDPALVRAGALGILSQHHPTEMLSADDHYLTSDFPLPKRLARWATCWRIREEMPLAPKVISKVLRAHGIGKLILKKHRVAGDEAHWLRLLKPAGAQTATLVLVADGVRGMALLCDPVPFASVE